MLRKLWQARPHPLRALQRSLNVEAEWAQFKTHMRPHRLKVVLLALAVSFPLYRPALNNWASRAKKYLAERTNEAVSKGQPARTIADNL